MGYYVDGGAVVRRWVGGEWYRWTNVEKYGEFEDIWVEVFYIEVTWIEHFKKSLGERSLLLSVNFSRFIYLQSEITVRLFSYQ